MENFIEINMYSHPLTEPILYQTAPACQCGGTNAIGGANALAQGWVDLAEGGPLCPLLLPAVQHQLMEMWRAVNWSREPETILNGLDHLQDVQKKENHYIRLENLQLVRFF